MKIVEERGRFVRPDQCQAWEVTAAIRSDDSKTNIS